MRLKLDRRQRGRQYLTLLVWTVMVVGGFLAAPVADADFTTVATDWNNFFTPPGFVLDYTKDGSTIHDHETSSDPTNGGAAVQPADSDIASCSPGADPGACSSPIFGYYNGGTTYDPNDPATMNDDFIFFRMRLEGDPRKNSPGTKPDAFNSRHWNVLLDVDGDGYKEFWIDLEGDFSSNDHDRLNILFNDDNRQDIPDPDVARVDFFMAASEVDQTLPPESHTRVIEIGDGSGDFYVDYQIPLTAFDDLNGNQVLFPDSPVSFFYSTSASNTDPLQKDHMTDGDFISLDDPISFGDPVFPNGQPLVEFTNADLDFIDTYEIGDAIQVWVTDRFANMDPTVAETVTVTITNPTTGDDETITLTETEPNSGIFTSLPLPCPGSCLSSSETVGMDQDGDLESHDGETILVSYTNALAQTVTDNATMLGTCGALVQFTRANGLPSDEFELGSDELFVTITYPDGDTDPTVAESIVAPDSVVLKGLDLQTMNGRFVLTETGPDTGVFRNTTGLPTEVLVPPATAEDGLWEDIDDGTVTATFSYTCGGAPRTRDTTTMLFFTDAGGRVSFSNGAGTKDVEVYGTNQPIFVKVSDDNACTTTVGGVETVTATVTSDVGDSETLTLFETFPGSGVFLNRKNDLVTTSGSPVVTSASSDFLTEGVTAGDTFVIADGPDVGSYTVASVDSATQITLTGALGATRTGVGFNASPLLAATFDGAFVIDDGTLEANHNDGFTVSYTDCDDGDGDPSNDVKQDTARYSSPPLVLNQVQFFPPVGCEAEFVEILNNSDSTLNATGFEVRDEDAFSYTIPQLGGSDILLQPGQRIFVILEQGTDTFRSDLGIFFLHTGVAGGDEYGDPDDADPADQATLLDPAGVVVDYVGWSHTISPSLDFQSDDSPAVLRSIWSDDSFRSTTGIAQGQSMIRTSDGFDTDSPSDWTFTTASLCSIVATRAFVVSFEASVEDGQVVVEWETGAEDGTLGFHLERRQDDRYTRVNDEILPSLAFSAPASRYRLVDREADPRATTLTYRLVELETAPRDGTRKLRHGPYVVELGEGGESEFDSSGPDFQARGREVSAGQLRRLEKQAREHAEHVVRRGGRFGDRVKVSVVEDGLYHVRAADLAPLFNLPAQAIEGWIRAGTLELENRGRPVAWLADDDGAGLVFYGLATTTIFTRENVYWLAKGQGLEMAEERGSGPLPAPGTQTFFDTVDLEVDLLVATTVPEAPDDDFWFWGGVIANHPVLGKASFPFALDALAPTTDDAALRLRLHGGSAMDIENEHHAEVILNGVLLGDTRWQGLRAHSLELTFPQSLLVSGHNTLEVRGVRDSAVPFSLFFIDGFEVGYSRHYAATDSSLVLRGDGNSVVTVSGFDDSQVQVLDITDPARPRHITATTVDADATGFRVSFRPTSPEAELLVASAAARRAPLSVVADQPSSLRDPENAVDYLVLAPGELLEAARELAEHRSSRGLLTLVADLEDVHDEFNHGVPSPHALRRLLAHAHHHWRQSPRYVVLVGGGNFDHLNVLGRGGNLMPPLLELTPHGAFVADNRLADVVGNDGVPEFAVGRLPVLTSGELEAYVQKIIAYETSPDEAWKNRALLVADNNVRDDGDFLQNSEAMASLLKPTAVPERLYLALESPSSVRQRLLSELSQGASWFNYVGHAGFDILADEKIFRSTDVPGLGNGERLPVLTAFACAVNRFEFPGLPSLGEVLTLEPNGGAAAVWAPSGLSFDVEAAFLGREFFLAATQSPDARLGDAVLGALRLYANQGGERHMLSIYNLLGDPALPLPASLTGF